jgi:hypothetical protein
MVRDDDTPAERGWLWRRSYTFAATTANLVLVGIGLWRLSDPVSLKWVCLALIANNIVLAGFYLGGASVLDWARLAAAWKSGKSEKVTVETPSGTVTQTTTETKPTEIDR